MCVCVCTNTEFCRYVHASIEVSIHFEVSLLKSSKYCIFNFFLLQVGGNTLYNMLKLQEVDVGPNDRPYYPVKIISTEVSLIINIFSNYFFDCQIL